LKIDLWNEALKPESGYDRVVVSLTRLSHAECTDEWGNSEEGKEHLAGCILHVNGPKPHEVKMVTTQVREGRKEFTLHFKQDPCPVLFFGSTHCPICGGTHEDENRS